MTKTKMILMAFIAAGAAAATFGLILWLVHFGGNPLSGYRRHLLTLLLPAEVIGELQASRTAFLIVGFLEFFVPYLLVLLGWSWMHARKRV